MKTHTSNFKNAIKTFGRELDSKITYTENNTTIELGNEQLNSITPHYEGGILKSVMKQLDIDSNVEIPLGTILTYQFGVKVGNSYEYINFGNYVVYKSEKQEDTNSYKITCYDKMLYAMKEYEDIGVTYPITIRDYITTLCSHIGLTFRYPTGTFANYSKQIPKELYLDENGNSLGYTFRDVLDEIAQASASTICINETDDTVEIRYLNNTNDTIDEEFLKDVNVDFGEKFGAVNTIVLSRSAGSDNIYYPSTLPENPVEIKIVDNQIMNGNDRDTYMANIYAKLNGLEYYINDFSSTGVCYYNLCDKYNVSIGENTYSCVMFNDEINITQGLQENIYTDMPEESVTDYTKADKTDRRINQAYIIVNKQQQEITALVSTTQDIQKEINPTDSTNGSSIYLEDSTDAELVSFEVEGKTEQATRSGKNLFNKNDVTSNYRLNSDGTVLSSNGFSVSNYIKVSPSTKYTFSRNSSETYYGNICEYTTSKAHIQRLYIASDKTSYTFTTTSTTEYVRISDGTDNLNYEQLELGNSSTSYEEYGVMPSPDYPSELVSVGYQNLFNINGTKTNYNATSSILNNTLTVIATGEYAQTNYSIELDKGNYNISGDYTNSNSSLTSAYVQIRYNNTQLLSINTLNMNGFFKGTFTVNEKGTYQIRFSNNGTSSVITNTSTYTNIMISKYGTSYIDYGKYGLEVVSQGANYFDTSKITNTNIIVSDNGKTLTMPIVTSGNGITGAGATLKQLAPNLKVGDTVYLYATRTPSTYNKYIYLHGSSFIWNFGNSKTITQQDLNGNVSFYANRYSDGETSQVVITDFRIVKTQNTAWEEYKSKKCLYTLNEPLRGIGNIKDLLYIKNGMLYVDRKIGSVVLNGTESDWWYQNTQFRKSLENAKQSTECLSNYYKNTGTDNRVNIYLENYMYIENSSITTLESWKTWLSTHNTEVNYILETPYTEELGEVDIPVTYKDKTHIDTTDDLQPKMYIDYVRDTQLTNYVEEHISQIVINEEGITQRVETIEDSDYDSRINAVEQRQTDTELTVDVISTNIDKTNGNIQEVTTTTGFTFNAEGMSIKQGDFEILQTPQGAYYKEGNNVVGEYTKDGSKQKDLALFGVYYYGMKDKDDTPMFVTQLYTDDNNEECVGHFYNGGN